MKCPCLNTGDLTRKELARHLVEFHLLSPARATLLAFRIDAKEELAPEDLAVLGVPQPAATVRKPEPERGLPDDAALNRAAAGYKEDPPPVRPPTPAPGVKPTPPAGPKPVESAPRPQPKRPGSHAANPAGCRYCKRYEPDKCARHGGPARSTSFGGRSLAERTRFRIEVLRDRIDRGHAAQAELDEILGVLAKVKA